MAREGQGLMRSNVDFVSVAHTVLLLRAIFLLGLVGLSLLFLTLHVLPFLCLSVYLSAWNSYPHYIAEMGHEQL